MVQVPTAMCTKGLIPMLFVQNMRFFSSKSADGSLRNITRAITFLHPREQFGSSCWGTAAEVFKHPSAVGVKPLI